MERKYRVLLHLLIGLLWLATGSGLATRIQLVFDYTTLPLVPPAYEIVAVPTEALLVLALPMLLVVLASWRGNSSNHSGSWLRECAFLLACLPLLFTVARCAFVGVPERSWWEPIWFSIWTGVGIRLSLTNVSCANARWPGAAWAVFFASTLGIGLWWLVQSSAFFADFQLGFNDFGHFSQRISSTASGTGFLRESPVLPPFWDHFNPGLIFLVPLWMVWPSVTMIFTVQAACLAGSAFLVAAIAKAKGHPAWVACSWGIAWLVFPTVGQMNVAYTYGWHPISLAIPCLLASYLCIIKRRWTAAVAFALLAASFEEGVLVATSCFAIAMAIRSLVRNRNNVERLSSIALAPISNCEREKQPNGVAPRNTYQEESLGAMTWCCVAIVAATGFFAVYRWSGLAEFQTGRFARLGGSPFEIMLSPFLRPATFWGLLLRERNLPFLFFLFAPFIAGVSSPWVWYVLATLPPLAVLMVWEHMPAQSIAFQYTSVLIPILFVGAIRDARHGSSEPDLPAYNDLGLALGVVACSWCLSLFVGQMPWSVDSLVDVKAKTYGIQSTSNRSVGSDVNVWLSSLVTRIRQGEFAHEKLRSGRFGDLRILATGRIAAHVVGANEIETVGQFWQRSAALQQLDMRLESPILRYDLLVLDHHESFQQTSEETRKLKAEALQIGFVEVDTAFGIDVLMKLKMAPSP